MAQPQSQSSHDMAGGLGARRGILRVGGAQRGDSSISGGGVVMPRGRLDPYRGALGPVGGSLRPGGVGSGAKGPREGSRGIGAWRRWGLSLRALASGTPWGAGTEGSYPIFIIQYTVLKTYRFLIIFAMIYQCDTKE